MNWFHAISRQTSARVNMTDEARALYFLHSELMCEYIVQKIKERGQIVVDKKRYL